mmetsp:Transcript_8775/g.14946  ORF Transcript_8775/g.14946 Transcript_8775/m.14946 type:complete len:89 (-) Transcript_8775:297-563(-)|eukprot:CAMPEP_0114428742 /NCGR_PEP_ID=MMETSP0103-20121206/9100_1 /TAXON_ID=37642 ORGANISM="Paraphysomonas imperforata, Strain PA2" /NCGR_SAMPLE_ID=MMETSP0103 /ASSEMBLY_ACC=CAM_ASM_000201 /LENGTH=88 /DNA_ID=CAMNT_0001598003 /DNA_START=119 /DNA_END=385 /DNA_ORIENTATION=+
MNHALEASIKSNNSVKGILCADNNGLCISAVGELSAQQAGRYASISRTATSLNADTPATVLIETDESHILVKDYDSMTIVLKCHPTED